MDSFTIWLIYPPTPQKDPWYLWDGMLGGPQSQSGYGDKEKNLLCQKSNPGHPTSSQSL
jgi:hypothetical protein